ncbi:MAG: ABC transporter ATP-binding protein [Nannocystales bacterium]
MTAASIEVRGLSHRYPGADVQALNDVSFGVDSGQRLGLLGPNGAGKSTLMRLLCGYLPLAGSGQLRVDGLDVATDSLKVRTRAGYMPEHVPLYPELRVHEHLSFRASIKRVPRGERRAEVERVASKTGLSDRLQQPISQLSRGYRQRVGIADALLGAPALIVLDEPTVGLDPNQVLEIRAMLRELGGAHTLVFSSHILAEVEALCDRVVILSEGRVVVDESLEDALATGHVHVRVVAGTEQTQALLSKAVEAEVEVVEDAGICSARLPLAAHDDPEAVLAAVGRACAQAGVELRTLSMGRTRLEERFAAVTGARRA